MQVVYVGGLQEYQMRIDHLPLGNLPIIWAMLN